MTTRDPDAICVAVDTADRGVELDRPVGDQLANLVTAIANEAALTVDQAANALTKLARAGWLTFVNDGAGVLLAIPCRICRAPVSAIDEHCGCGQMSPWHT